MTMMTTTHGLEQDKRGRLHVDLLLYIMLLLYRNADNDNDDNDNDDNDNDDNDNDDNDNDDNGKDDNNKK